MGAGSECRSESKTQFKVQLFAENPQPSQGQPILHRYDPNSAVQNKPDLMPHSRNSPRSRRENSIAQSHELDSQEVEALTMTEIAELLSHLKNWEYTNEGFMQRIWQFGDFQSALEWVKRAGFICEMLGHHADFTLARGQANATIQTKVLVGLSRADVELAARLEVEGIDQITPWKVTSLT
jgi:4a-hydroxytetrahydrobiopterin dehydratase